MSSRGLRGHGCKAVLLYELRESGALHAQEGSGAGDVALGLGQGARDAIALDLTLDIAERHDALANLGVRDLRRAGLADRERRLFGVVVREGAEGRLGVGARRR